MRTFLAAAAMLLLVAPGCGDDNNNATPDMAMKAADMAAPAGDMAKIATCQEVLGCIVDCKGNGQCTLACQANASTAALQYFQPFALCLYDSCSTVDGGTGMCQLPPGSDPSNACGQCLGGAFVSSTMAGKACHAEYTACASH